MNKESGIINIDKEKLKYSLKYVDKVNYDIIEKESDKEKLSKSISNIYKRLSLNLKEIVFIPGFKSLKDHALELKKNCKWNLSESDYNLNISNEEILDIINSTLKTDLTDGNKNSFFNNQSFIKTVGRDFANILLECKLAGLQNFKLKEENKHLERLSLIYQNCISAITNNEILVKVLRMNSFNVNQELLDHSNDIINIKQNAFKVFFTPSKAYVIEKPKYYYKSKVTISTRSKLTRYYLHNQKGPSLFFKDGSHYSYYLTNEIPNWYWDMKDSQKKMYRVLRIRNTTIRDMVIDYIGKDRFLSYMNKKVTDEKGDYRVVLFELPTRFPSQKIWCPYLEMKNPSTGETHIEGIDSRIRKVDTALKWRLGLQSFEKASFSS